MRNKISYFRKYFLSGSLSVVILSLCLSSSVFGTEANFSNRFTFIGQFSDGLCRISDGELTGYVDLTGNIVIEPAYPDAYDFPGRTEEPAGGDTSGLHSFKGKGSILWGFADADGVQRIGPEFYEVKEFSEGLAAVSFNNKWGYINEKGETVIPMMYEHAESFSQGLAIVNNVYAIDESNLRILRCYNVDGRKGIIYYSAEDRPDERYIEETDNAIIYGLLESGLQRGYTKRLTRAEFCILIMHMMSGAESAGSGTEFYFEDTDDIDINNAFYMRIVDGVGGRLYAPDIEITRQEAARILLNYAKYLGMDSDFERRELSDREQFADWAEDGIDYAVDRGLLQTESGMFEPLGKCTKQESIALIYSFYKLFSEQM